MPRFGTQSLFVMVPLFAVFAVFAVFVLIALLVRRLVGHLGGGAISPSRVVMGR
jgi:hypothetical protein